MLRCTIRISSHDLTHHSVIPYRNNLATSPDVATPQLTSLSILNYTATILPLLPRLPTSPPFRNTIPSTPSVSFFYISQVPSYLLTPWHAMWYDRKYVARHIGEIGGLWVRFLLPPPPVGYVRYLQCAATLHSVGVVINEIWINLPPVVCWFRWWFQIEPGGGR